MKKNTSLLLLITFGFYSSTAPMEIAEKFDDTPGFGKHQYNNTCQEECPFNELMPVTSASIAIIAFFEGADKGVDGRLDLIDRIFQKGFSVLWKGCVKLTKWFMKD